MSRRARIETLLSEALAPTHLAVEDESHMHATKPGAESHFKIVVVSRAFEGLGAIARQRRVNQALREVFSGGLHALTMHVATPDEWAASPEAPESPACLGGSKREPRAPAARRPGDL
jgi:BolA protein